MLTYSDLDSYLSRDTQQSMDSLPTSPFHGTHSTGVGGGLERQHEESRESLLPPSTSGGRFLPPIPPNYGLKPNTTSTTSTTTTNTEASLTPPNLPQTAEYGHGQQNYHMPQGHQASYSTQSPNNYMQHETQQPSKKQRVERPQPAQNTPSNESYIPGWNQTVTPLSTSGQFHGPHFTAHQPGMLGMSSGEVPGNGLGQHNIPRR